MTAEARAIIEGAFRVLGLDPTPDELTTVAAMLRDAGEEIVAAVTGAGTDVAEIARAAGSSGFVALDLAAEF